MKLQNTLAQKCVAEIKGLNALQFPKRICLSNPRHDIRNCTARVIARSEDDGTNVLRF